MEDDSSIDALSAPHYEREGDTLKSCTICNRLLDAAHRIIEMSIQKRDHGVEFGQKMHDTVPLFQNESLSNIILAHPNCGKHQDFMRNIFFMDNDMVTNWDLSEDIKIEAKWHADQDRAVFSAAIAIGHFMLPVYNNHELLLLDSEPHLPTLPCVGRPRDEHFISIDLMRQWISTCEMNHKTSCCVPTLPSITLSWVIDTISHCLVPAAYDTRYVALSYVWGQTDMLKTTQETLCSLRKVGALSATSHFRVPPVVQHAISLTSQLGQRYLWIDSLCIMQDDLESLDHHIHHMASIYEAAFFTIVAADGVDAEHGILGIKGVSDPRTIPHPVLQLSKRLGLRLRGRINIHESAWGHRGWTLQEHIFSKRKLVFVDGSVQWICQESRCFEDICQESLAKRKKRRQDHDLKQELESVGELVRKYPMISQIEELLWQYTMRDLTFADDVIRAIDSVFTACGEAYPSGFFLGLPIDFFDMALLWYHSCGDNWSARRRTAVPPATQRPVPSWTWAGWKGLLKMGAWNSATYIKDADEPCWFGKRCSTIPMLEWKYRSDGDTTETPIPGQNNAYAYKQKFMGKEGGLPLGWKYEREPLHPIQGDDRPKHVMFNESEDCGMATPYYYSHESAPGIKFWHPVPISFGTQESATTPINGRILCANAQGGCLWITAAKDRKDVDDEWRISADARDLHLFGERVSVEALLVGKEGEIAGDLYISDGHNRDLVKKYEKQPDEAGYPCELVAISKGNDYVFPMEPERETFTFYNVLWIKWEHGIAYRRGLGRVKKEIWESMELEDVDLILG